MPWYDLCEARLVQVRTINSAADATSVDTSGYLVPEGKVWCILAFGYFPSAAETKTINIVKVSPTGSSFGLLNPVSLALNPAVGTYIEQGMEYFLLPGEYIKVIRDSATAGSTMYLNIQYVEIDLPLYVYDEPQKVKLEKRAISSLRQQLGGGIGGGSVRPGTLTVEPGGRGGPLRK